MSAKGFEHCSTIFAWNVHQTKKQISIPSDLSRDRFIP